MSELDEIFPVARIKVFTGEYKLYTDMSELDKEIKEVDVYSKEQVLKLLEPQLTIPKSIADTLDIAIKGLTKFEDYLWAVDEFDILVPYDRAEYFRKWSNEEMNAHALAVSYVTGKALGVELVKVV